MEAGHSQGHPAVPPEARDGPQSAPRTPAGPVATVRSPPSLRSPHVINIDDLRRRARRRLPRVVFNYVDGGADDEVTLRENCRVFQDVTFRPRQAVAMSSVDLRTRVLGTELAFPALLAPIGYLRLIHPRGELDAARAAGAAGIGFIQSTISGHALEKTREASTGPVGYQLYLVGGRAASEAAIERARVAGFSALYVTIDTPVAGLRERDFRGGMRELLGGSFASKLRFLPQFVVRPRWVAGFLRDGGVPRLENVVIPGEGPMQLIDVVGALARSRVTWDDFRWIRQAWPGPLVAKGVLTGDDARRAIDHGATGIVVSNHGGRQLDGASATLRALPEVVAAVAGQAEVLMDGGIRRGSDIVKAICLGARAVLVGRAYVYGLAAAGQTGVTRALEILRTDVERTLKLLGCPSIAALDGSYVDGPFGSR
ncbi:MAG: alpha-hydroxy-acid oxidizing protein [Deltaproteobacteria bacterium]|nr:MAG: alpha-hydroxy-acid oxidizing protein [Deltaproteobacteria bacterium]TMQ19701.1 MAG: alpha-hydroxy-acid oxidizing protein [Deltaproteobacteria bacterium]